MKTRQEEPVPGGQQADQAETWADLKTLESMLDILRPLTQEDRVRLVDTVCVFLEIEVSQR